MDYFKVFLSLLILTETVLTCEKVKSWETIQLNFGYDRYYSRSFYGGLICSNLNCSTEIKYDQSVTLSRIIVKNSNITVLTTLPKYPTVVILYLNQIHINTIIPGAFKNLAGLEVLRLDSNELSELSNGVYSSLNSLIFLNLTNNRINKIENGALNGLKNLKTLYLNNNKLVTLEYKVFEILENLIILDISFNRISTIDSGAFVDLKSLRVLYLQHNSIVKIDQLPNGLEIVDFSFNTISTIQVDAFFGLTSLTNLTLQHNNITKINQNLFKDLTKLQYLNLSHNGIEEIVRSFDSLKNLKILDVSSNRLTYFSKHTFMFMSMLQRLYLDDNQLSSLYIDQEVNIRNEHLKLVSLDNNPWICEDLVRMIVKLHIKGVKTAWGGTYDRQNFHGITCKIIEPFVE